MEADAKPFDQWVILELMGHRRLAGKLTEATIAGDGFLRLDVYAGENQEAMVTQFYQPSAVYAITPTTEPIARLIAASAQAGPISPWEIRAMLEDEVGATLEGEEDEE